MQNGLFFGELGLQKLGLGVKFRDWILEMRSGLIFGELGLQKLGLGMKFGD